MNLKLFGYWRSSASWRIRWAMNLKKIPYDYLPVNILKGEHREPPHLARTPLGTLPVMEIEPGNFLSQSIAILQWLEDSFASEPYIFGKDRTHRYRILELCEIINCDTAPLQTPRAQNAHSDDAAKKSEFATRFIRAGLAAFDKLVEKTGGKFCVGDSVTAADLFVVPQIYNANRFKIAVAHEFPRLHAIYDTCLASDECLRASPEKQIDAVPA